MDTTPAPPESAAQVRFQLASDLHMHGNGGLGNNLPGYQWSLIPPPPSADYLLLPGDIGAIGKKRPGGKKPAPGSIDHPEEYRQWLIRICANYQKVFLIPGNHEYRGDSILNTDNVMNSWENDPAMRGRLKIMTNESYDLLDDQGRVLVTIIGSVLWTYIQRNQQGRGNDDFRTGGIANDSPAAHNERFRVELAGIQGEVDKVRKQSQRRRILVMTHHAPALRAGCSNPDWDGKGTGWTHYQSDVLGGVGIDGLKTGDVWVFGHTHWNADFMQDEVRVIANQRGRINENPAFTRDFAFTM